MSCPEKYPTRILLICFVFALAGATAACNSGEGDEAESLAFSEDEKYLIDAYVDIKRARSHYPHNPTAAESLFMVLDSTLDSVRIANTIRTVNQEPERWLAIYVEIEQLLQGRDEQPESGRAIPGSSGSKEPGG